jgi:hypothetical protein
MIITKMSLPRRTFLRGMGTTLTLPLLDAMVPALTAMGKTEAKPVLRFACVYVGNGVDVTRWAPTKEGTGFEFTPILKPLEPLRDRVLVLSGLDNRPALPLNDRGGQHSRSGVAFMSATHAKQTEGADMRAGTTIDQYAAQELGKDTQLSSLELALDHVDSVGACENNYTCSYVNSISWRSPTTPLPMEFNPRFVFERLFGNGDTAQERLAQIRQDLSILDSLMDRVGGLRKTLGPRDSAKISEFLEAIRDVERRIQKVEKQNAELPVPERPLGVPNTVKEHVDLLFDLQMLAFQADITRVATFMLGRELALETYDEIGIPEGHHTASHHGNIAEKRARYAKLNTYHIQLFTAFLKKLQATSDGDGNLLDHSLILYGSGMSEGNEHNNFDVPIVLVGGAAARIKGGRHVRYQKGTPLANLMLTLLDKLDVPMEKFGDSTGRLEL